jgi:[acyl-carrier-protein] S-malonyltransferase
MRIAYVFPGQGAQYVGMGKDLCASSSIAAEMFNRADEIIGAPLSKICFEGPEEELRKTENTQPAIFLHSMVLWNVLKPADAAMVAGHSLGEYSALVAAEALTFEEALQLVRLRGELMQKAGEDHPGTMAAIVGLNPDKITEICSAAAASGIVQGANFNSPGQVVISGSIAGVRRAMELAKTHGAKLAKELVVSGAFHSPLMQSAKDALKTALNAANIRDARIPVYANVTAKPVRWAGEIKQLLYEQVTSPVRWEESVQSMVSDGATKFIELGPGKVLQGLIRRTAPAVETTGADLIGDLEKLETRESKMQN